LTWALLIGGHEFPMGGYRNGGRGRKEMAMPRQTWTERSEYEYLRSGPDESSTSAKDRRRTRNQLYKDARRRGIPGQSTLNEDRLEAAAGRD
jgi:hypothetical protein